MARDYRLTAQEQAAALGHALRNPKIWLALESAGIDRHKFSDGPTGELFAAAVQFLGERSRPPKTRELAEYLLRLHGDLAVRPHHAALKAVVEAAKAIGEDVVQAQLTSWAKWNVMAAAAAAIQEAVNQGDLGAAYRQWATTDTDLKRIDAMVGQGRDAFQSSAVRMRHEAAERYAEGERTLSWGVDFLDDCLVTLARKELVMIGASTGVGKTEIARIIGKHNAAQGKVVHGFFLEAEEDEIERRTKYGMLLECYTRGGGLFDPKEINYIQWRLGRCRATLDRYADEVEAAYEATYSTFHTYYRSRQGFGAKDLEREILDIYKTADMILVDHLQYLDIDAAKNEVAETTALVKTMRDMTLTLGVPIVCIVHLVKNPSDGLTPTIPDLYGAGNVSKIATTIVTMAPYRDFDFACVAPDGAPTLIQAQKYRLGGERAAYAGVAFYQRDLGAYASPYCLGTLNSSRTKWTSSHARIPRWWPHPERVIAERPEDDVEPAA